MHIQTCLETSQAQYKTKYLPTKLTKPKYKIYRSVLFPCFNHYRHSWNRNYYRIPHPLPRSKMHSCFHIHLPHHWNYVHRCRNHGYFPLLHRYHSHCWPTPQTRCPTKTLHPRCCNHWIPHRSLQCCSSEMYTHHMLQSLLHCYIHRHCYDHRYHLQGYHRHPPRHLQTDYSLPRDKIRTLHH